MLQVPVDILSAMRTNLMMAVMAYVETPMKAEAVKVEVGVA